MDHTRWPRAETYLRLHQEWQTPETCMSCLRGGSEGGGRGPEGLQHRVRPVHPGLSRAGLGRPLTPRSSTREEASPPTSAQGAALPEPRDPRGAQVYAPTRGALDTAPAPRPRCLVTAVPPPRRKKRPRPRHPSCPAPCTFLMSRLPRPPQQSGAATELRTGPARPGPAGRGLPCRDRARASRKPPTPRTGPIGPEKCRRPGSFRRDPASPAFWEM